MLYIVTTETNDFIRSFFSSFLGLSEIEKDDVSVQVIV